jgi:hypothetical protein
MANSILAFWLPGPLELIVIAIVFLLTFGVPILVVVLVVGYMLGRSRETQRLQLEVDKLADELEKLRSQANQTGKSDPGASG